MALTSLDRSAIDRAQSRVEALERQVSELQRRYSDREDLPGYHSLLRLLLLVARDVGRKVDDLAGEMFDGRRQEDPDEFIEDLRKNVDALEKLTHPRLALASRPHGDAFEPLAGPFARLAHGIAPERELLFEALDDRRYRVLYKVVEELRRLGADMSADLKAAMNAAPRLTVVGYPASDEDDSLQHLVVAHELAHLVLQAPLPRAELRTGLRQTGDRYFFAAVNEHADELHAEIAENQAHGTTGKQLDDAVELTLKRLRSWFDELACDLLAVRLVGPAYLLALYDFAMPTSRWTSKDSRWHERYPPLAWRLREIGAEALHFLPTLGRPFAESREVITSTLAQIPDVDYGVAAVERQILDDALKRLRRDVHQLLGQSRYRRRMLREELLPVWDKLDMKIPPAERIRDRPRADQPRMTAEDTLARIRRRLLRRPPPEFPAAAPDPNEPVEAWSTPMDWRSILNGAYLHWSHSRLMADEDAPDYTGTRRDLNDLMRGTVELSEIHTQMHRLRRQLDGLNFPD